MNWFDVAKWILAAVLVPFLGWMGGTMAVRRESKRRKESLIRFLSGLPKEAKAVLVDFYMERTHTMRGNPGAPAVALLLSMRVLREGPGGGTYDAVDRYLSIRPDLWEVMNDWIVREMIEHAAAEADSKAA